MQLQSYLNQLVTKKAERTYILFSFPTPLFLHEWRHIWVVDDKEYVGTLQSYFLPTKLSWDTKPLLYLTSVSLRSLICTLSLLPPYKNLQVPRIYWAVFHLLSWFLSCPPPGMSSLYLSVWPVWLYFRSKMKYLLSETFPDFLQGRIDHVFIYHLSPCQSL